jgi:hypothetical protein
LLLALRRELVLPFLHALAACPAIPRAGAKLLDLLAAAQWVPLALREGVVARIGQLFAVILEALTDVPPRGLSPEVRAMTLEILPADGCEVVRPCRRDE